MTLRLATAGESHGPALVAIVTGLPAGLVLDREAINVDLRRRQQGYGRSPRQQIEQDRVEVLAGLRRGRTLGTPLALVVRNNDHKNWTWGMAPWPTDEEPSGKGTKAVTLPRPGHADLEQRVDDARADRDTVGGVVEVRASGVPPGLGSYATKDERLDARLAATLMGTQAVKGVEIGEGFELASKRGSAAHDEIVRDERGLYRETNRAGGIEGGISNGEEIVVRAAMKPLPTLMKPLASVDLETGEPAQALVERSDTAAVEALSVVAEACVAWELARAAKEKFGGDALADLLAAHRAYLERIDWSPR